MKIYKKLFQKNDDGKFFEEFDLPDGLDVPNGDYTTVAPPDNLKHPKWDFEFNSGWIEDKDSIIEDLQKKNGELLARQVMSEEALLELANMILAR
ncbi:hypothetical protein [Enterococcus asini]|uniref:hypothetical protein n=1 Tax=Enterococcus asini TaxID=57732 RepID=UPI000E4908FA|nr:hypothetical protein [Enterococcus asini]RGW15199.1 hypothetical protein DWV91_01050 [Enterococcus asini]